jgi:hypothetical protein
MEQSVKEFFSSNNWFDKKYREKGSTRRATFKIALNLFLQNGGRRIVETGCVRLQEDWGGGMSTLLFGHFAKVFNVEFISVDINPFYIRIAKNITEEFSKHINFVESDSVKFLESFSKPIDLLYLDSLDYPLGDLLNIYGGKEDIDKALKILKDLGEDEVYKRHKNIVLAAQEHQLNELKAAEDKLSNHAILMLDDSDLPGGGKSKLTKEYLFKKNWKLVLDDYQDVWVKRI